MLRAVVLLLLAWLISAGGVAGAQTVGVDSLVPEVLEAGESPVWSALRRELAAGGPLAVLFGFLAMIVVAILPIPAEVPAALNGMFLGPWLGSAVSWTGALCGALISFEIARRFGRPLLARVAAARVVAVLDRTADTIGARGLLVVRLIPVIAFTAINYAAGMSTVPRWTFAWTTALGILPGALLMTSSGSGLAALYRGNQTLAVVLTAGLLVIVVLWRMRRTRRPAPDA